MSNNTTVCPKCGESTAQNPLFGCSSKSRLIALILCLFFGVIGVHRFYAGRVASGIFMILTAGGLGIWNFIDTLVILCGNFKDGDGRVIKDWNLD